MKSCALCRGVNSCDRCTFINVICCDHVSVQGQEIEGAGEGFLCMKAAWPSTIRTIFGDQDRFETTYFAPFKVRFHHDFSWPFVLGLGKGVGGQ